MAKRYFKATDGTITVFRATATRAYVSALWERRPSGEPYALGFSSKPVTLGTYPTVEIVQSEYEALQAAKTLRQSERAPITRLDNSPQESWVYNVALAKP